MPEKIVNGAKIVSLSVNGKRHGVQRLALLLPNASCSPSPKPFDSRNKKKGFPSHFFNTPDNEGSMEPLPAKEHYDPKACPSCEPKKSNGGMQNKIPSTFSISKPNS